MTANAALDTARSLFGKQGDIRTLDIAGQPMRYEVGIAAGNEWSVRGSSVTGWEDAFRSAGHPVEV